MFKYKIDVLAALKAAGYNTNRLRIEKILSEGTIQKLRHKKLISIVSLERICDILDKEPGEIIGRRKEDEEV